MCWCQTIAQQTVPAQVVPMLDAAQDGQYMVARQEQSDAPSGLRGPIRRRWPGFFLASTLTVYINSFPNVSMLLHLLQQEEISCFANKSINGLTTENRILPVRRCNLRLTWQPGNSEALFAALTARFTRAPKMDLGERPLDFNIRGDDLPGYCLGFSRLVA